jgi:uncharacterized protein YkwD
MRRYASPAVLLLIAAAISGTLYAADASSSAITAETVLRLMNDYRAESGLAPLRLDDRLMEAAADRMRHMEDEGYWSHQSPDGMSPFVWMAVRAYRYRTAAENLATGFETAPLLVASWMESPGHRANILSPDIEDCGIAIIDGATTGPATGRSVIVLFGKRQPPQFVTRSSGS